MHLEIFLNLQMLIQLSDRSPTGDSISEYRY